MDVRDTKQIWAEIAEFYHTIITHMKVKVLFCCLELYPIHI